MTLTLTVNSKDGTTLSSVSATGISREAAAGLVDSALEQAPPGASLSITCSSLPGRPSVISEHLAALKEAGPALAEFYRTVGGAMLGGQPASPPDVESN